VGNASALDSALLVVMWGALFGALQGVAICEAEELRLDAYMSYLRPVLAQVNGRMVDTVKRIEDRRFAGRRGDAHDRRCTLRGASSPARAVQGARDPSCCAGCVRPALPGGHQGWTRS
jgi:hypothetical protein